MRWNEIKDRKLKKFSRMPPSRAQVLIEASEEQQLDESRRKYIKVGHEQIGIDKPHHPGQQVHAHLPDDTAVNKDGSQSHGNKPFTIKKAWADALRDYDFAIPQSRLIESVEDTVTVELNRDLLEFLQALRSYLQGPDAK